MEDIPLLKKNKPVEDKEDKPKSKRSVMFETQLQALTKGREKRFENILEINIY